MHTLQKVFDEHIKVCENTIFIGIFLKSETLYSHIIYPNDKRFLLEFEVSVSKTWNLIHWKKNFIQIFISKKIISFTKYLSNQELLSKSHGMG